MTFSLGKLRRSLIGVSLKIEGSLKVDVSVLELLQEITTVQLAARILSSLQFDESSNTVDAVPSMTEIEQLIAQADSTEIESLLAELEQTSESDELESLLAELELSLNDEANV